MPQRVSAIVFVYATDCLAGDKYAASCVVALSYLGRDSRRPSPSFGQFDFQLPITRTVMQRSLILVHLEAAKKNVCKAEDFVRRQKAFMPSFLGTPAEQTGRNVLSHLEDYLAKQVDELNRLQDLLEHEPK